MHVGVEPVDDLMHAIPSGEPNWSESTQLVFHDATSGTALMVHFQLVSTNPPHWEGNLACFRPDGRIMVSRTFGNAQRTDGFHAPPLSCTPTSGLGDWTLSFNGMTRCIDPEEAAGVPVRDGDVTALEFNFAIDATSPGWGTRSGNGGRDPLSRSLDHQSWGSMHLEQACRFVGWLRIDGGTVEVDCIGRRDHSCGPRSFEGIYRESWSCCTVPSGRSFLALDLYFEGRPPYQQGFLWDGSQVHTLSSVEGPRLENSLGEPHVFELLLGTASHEERVAGEMQNSMCYTLSQPIGQPMGFHAGRPMLVDGPARFDWDGEIGFGWCQRLGLS
jgi:hypothetical protein